MNEARTTIKDTYVKANRNESRPVRADASVGPIIEPRPKKPVLMALIVFVSWLREVVSCLSTPSMTNA